MEETQRNAMLRRVGIIALMIFVTMAVWVAYWAIWMTCRTPSNYNRLLVHMAATDARVQEFERLFPGAGRSISCYPPLIWGDNKWSSTASFYGRYELTMQFPVIVDYLGKTGKRQGPAEFYFQEITRVEKDPRFSGAGATIYYEGASLRFGEQEWNRLVASNGDFSVLGLTLKTNDPVPMIQEVPSFR
jgi:hypothetical protein